MGEAAGRSVRLVRVVRGVRVARVVRRRLGPGVRENPLPAAVSVRELRRFPVEAPGASAPAAVPAQRDPALKGAGDRAGDRPGERQVGDLKAAGAVAGVAGEGGRGHRVGEALHRPAEAERRRGRPGRRRVGIVRVVRVVGVVRIIGIVRCFGVVLIVLIGGVVPIPVVRGVRPFAVLVHVVGRRGIVLRIVHVLQEEVLSTESVVELLFGIRVGLSADAAVGVTIPVCLSGRSGLRFPDPGMPGFGEDVGNADEHAEAVDDPLPEGERGACGFPAGLGRGVRDGRLLVLHVEHAFLLVGGTKEKRTP